MQKQQARSTRAATVASAVAEDAAELASEQRISMYTEAPSGEVCIEDFERYAIDRLRGDLDITARSSLLRLLSSYISRWSHFSFHFLC